MSNSTAHDPMTMTAADAQYPLQPQSAAHRALWPCSSGFFSPMRIAVTSFPEVSEHVPDAVVLATITRINNLLKAHGPNAHFVIIVGTVVLYVVGGVIVGAVAAAAALWYLLHKKSTVTRKLEALLAEENAKEVYRAAQAQWVVTRRGVELIFSSWEVVDVQLSPLLADGKPSEAPPSAPPSAPTDGMPTYEALYPPAYGEERALPAPAPGVPAATSPEWPAEGLDVESMSYEDQLRVALLRSQAIV